jgi:hypothetical protein
MPLFACPRCETIENTALGKTIVEIVPCRTRRLCSACGFGQWHGRFPRERYAPERHGPISERGFVEPPDTYNDPGDYLREETG